MIPSDATPPSSAPLPHSALDRETRWAIYREVVTNSSAAIAVIDAEGSYLEQNPAHRALLGYSDVDLVGATPAIHLGEPTFLEVSETIRETGVYEGIVVSRTRWGEEILLELSAFAIRDSDGTPVCYVGIKRDLTELRPGASEELEQSTSLLEATLETTADGILVVDRSGRIVSQNKRFRKIWGIPDDVLARGDDEAAIEMAAEQLEEPEIFRSRVRELYEDPRRKSFDILRFRDGRIVERYSRPQMIGDEVVGRVWSFRDVTDRQQVEAALRESEARYRRLVEGARQGIYITTSDGDFLDANPAAQELFGYSRDELLRLNARDLYADPTDRETFRDRVAEDGSVEEYEVRLRRSDGSEIDCLLTTTARRNGSGEVVGYEGLVMDVTERKKAERSLRASERYFRSLIENALDTITILDPDGIIVYQSPSSIRVLGYEPEDLVGTEVFDHLHPDDADPAREEFVSTLDDRAVRHPIEVRFRHRDGSWRTLEVIAQNLLHDPDVGGVVVNARDVTARKRAEDQLVYESLHDRLTGLPNRALLMDRVEQLLRRARRPGAPGFSVLFLDMDNFKVVNDSLGHMAGDRLLIAVAHRLETCLRPGDTVARLGGDEFTMLLDSTDDVAEAARVAERIHQELRRPFLLDGQEVFTSVSIGIATSSSGYGEPEEILRDADLAMYRAKGTGRGRHEVFDRKMHDQAVANLELETGLRRALEREEFRLHYQPIIELAEGRVTAFEALLRWDHPERGLLLPGEFLDVAEESGLIISIGWWVLEEACVHMVEWMEAGRPVPVQVNLSGVQLRQADLVDGIGDLLERTGAPGELLTLELTESSMMADAEATVRTLESLRDLGITISIDDFGTGYSSLSYLHRFPTHRVKIDRSFVAALADRTETGGFVQVIVDLARDLGMDVVAEGIETAAQLQRLRELECGLGQGFYFARAVPPEEADRMLADGALPPPGPENAGS